MFREVQFVLEFDVIFLQFYYFSFLPWWTLLQTLHWATKTLVNLVFINRSNGVLMRVKRVRWYLEILVPLVRYILAPKIKQSYYLNWEIIWSAKTSEVYLICTCSCLLTLLLSLINSSWSKMDSWFVFYANSYSNTSPNHSLSYCCYSYRSWLDFPSLFTYSSWWNY